MTKTATDNQTSGWATTPMRYVALSIFWLAISLFWAMALTQIVPNRVLAFVGDEHKGAGLAIITLSGAFAAGLIQLFVGPISDRCRARWGRRRPFLLWGAMGGAASIVVFAYAHSFGLLVIAFIGIQILLNVANGPYQAMIPDHTPRDHQGRAAATMGFMQLIGEGGGPLLVGLVLDQAAHHPRAGLALLFHAPNVAMATRHLLLFDAAVIVICMLITLAFVPDAPADESARLVPLNPFKDLAIRENIDFYRLIVSRSLYNLGFYIALDFLLYYVRDSLGRPGSASLDAGMLQLTAVLFAVLGTIPSGWLSDHGHKKTAVYASCVFSAIAGIAFAVAPGMQVALVMAGFFGVGYGLFRAVDWAFACNLLPKRGGAARWLAIWSLSQIVPQVLAPGWGPIGDALNHLHPGYGWRGAMIACTLCVLGGASIVRLIAEPKIDAESSADCDFVDASSDIKPHAPTEAMP